ncbi:hypothetical protein B0H10DRAFT_1951625 [Mycena sp. CBHHK59/15]|nr:hypothetical protein B0H10DRAFT_1951625 [Mycena sp. CBHHK59/15]
MEASQARLASVRTDAIAAAAIAKLIKNIEHLSYLLPVSIAEGTEGDEIHRVITTIKGHDEDCAASTFNRHFDILFKEDAQCRDANGRLHLIRRGELGMLMVVRYLRDIKWSAPEMDLAGAKIKLERIVKEMEILSGASAADAKKKADALRKAPAATSSKKTVPPAQKKNHWRRREESSAGEGCLL